MLFFSNDLEFHRQWLSYKERAHPFREHTDERAYEHSAENVVETSSWHEDVSQSKIYQSGNTLPRFKNLKRRETRRTPKGAVCS